MIISIDHGNKSCKIPSRVFSSGLNESSTQPPFGDDILIYNGKYYTISEQRIPYLRDKTIDDRFYILTLFAIAFELEAAGVDPSTDIIDVTVLAGLPPAHYGALYEKFEDYFTRNRQVEEFVFHGKRYFLYIRQAFAYPQAYAAAMPVFEQIRTLGKALIFDLGGMTCDFIQIRNGQADLTVCDSLENGVIVLYNKIKSKVSAEYDMLLDEADIDAVLMEQIHTFGINVDKLICDTAQAFINDLFGKLRERMIDLRTCRTVFVGGGSILLKKQIVESGKVVNPIFVESVSANAQGYALLYNASQIGR